jgi:hypothetical protein
VSPRARAAAAGALGAALATLCLVALVPAQPRVDAPSVAAPALSSAPIGFVDTPLPDPIVGRRLAAQGWALAASGVRVVELRIDGAAFASARLGVARADVAAARPGYPNNASAGFEFDVDVSGLAPLRHELAIVAIAQNGRESVLARRGFVPPGTTTRTRGLLDARPKLAREPFTFLMMTSGVAQGGADEIDAQYRGYVTRTQRVGMSIPILYLRATRGAANDWVFDPDFDVRRKCGTRAVVDDNLTTVLRFAAERRVPVQFILNGGIWADATCNTPEWDLNDHLEEDDDNVQWSQSNRTFPDDHLKDLAGSMSSPELARVLTYHVHATKVRAYKKRNLQSAARRIAAFANANPDLFVGVVLDSDTYMNPFFKEQEIFDYNPGMIRQFREWLAGRGPYAGDGGPGAPDLRAYRRKPMTLAQVNRIAGKRWTTWNQVDPPRDLPGSARHPLRQGERPYWDDPWWHEWDMFRKHIVDLHYDELSTWVREAGIARDRIYSAQGFIAPLATLRPFAIRLTSHRQNYDSAGVSVEGAIPRDGHLGAVIYGEAARNNVRMEEPHSLFATFARMDPGWAVVEFNSTDLRKPTVLPLYEHAYRSFRDMFNFGASEVSAMAWNGSNGIHAGEAGYVPYTAWRNTPAEEAMRDFLVSHADVPRGAQVWTFGSARHADDDGWTARRGSRDAKLGYLALAPAGGAVALRSPDDLVVRPRAIDFVALDFGGGERPSRATVRARADSTSEWRTVGTSTDATRITLDWPAEWKSRGTIVVQLDLALDFAPQARSARLERVILYPTSSGP